MPGVYTGRFQPALNKLPQGVFRNIVQHLIFSDLGAGSFMILNYWNPIVPTPRSSQKQTYSFKDVFALALVCRALRHQIKQLVYQSYGEQIPKKH